MMDHPRKKTTYKKRTPPRSARTGPSLLVIIIGVIMFVSAFPITILNESRAARLSKKVREIGGTVVSIRMDRVDSENENRLIHVTGQMASKASLNDVLFGVKVDNAVKLKRTVLMYQWQEVMVKQKAADKNAEKEMVSTPTYKKIWSEALIDSEKFQIRSGHRNPMRKKYDSEIRVADRVMMGAFRLSESLIDQINGFVPIPEPSPDNIIRRYRYRFIPHDNGFYYGRDPEQPKIGDLKITFQVFYPQTVTIMAMQVSNTFIPFKTGTGNTIYLAKLGAHGIKDMAPDVSRSKTGSIWAVRVWGFLFMLIGFMIIFQPLSLSAVSGSIPMIGDLIKTGSVFVALFLGISFFMTTVAASTAIDHPVMAAVLMACVLGILKFLYQIELTLVPIESVSLKSRVKRPVIDVRKVSATSEATRRPVEKKSTPILKPVAPSLPSSAESQEQPQPDPISDVLRKQMPKPTDKYNKIDWVKKGQAMYHTGNLKGAVIAFSSAISADPEFAVAYFNRAFVYQKLGHKEHARKDIKAAAKLGHKRSIEILKKLS